MYLHLLLQVNTFTSGSDIKFRTSYSTTEKCLENPMHHNAIKDILIIFVS